MAKDELKERDWPNRLTQLSHFISSGKSLKEYIQDSMRGDHSNQAAPKISTIANAEELGALIQQHRREKGISQADLADIASISIGTIKNAEQGRNIGVVQMFAILHALGMSIYA